MELYRGPLLPGFYEAWIAPEQERLLGCFFDASGQLIGLLEGQGDTAGALAQARRACAADPLREEGHAHLIRMLAAAGQSGAALRQYREFERALDEDLGDEPSPALRALARRVGKESGSALRHRSGRLRHSTSDRSRRLGPTRGFHSRERTGLTMVTGCLTRVP